VVTSRSHPRHDHRAWNRVGVTVGTGAELPRWSKFAFVPRVSYHCGSVGDVTFPRGGPVVAQNWKHSMLLVGVALGLNTSRLAGP